MLSKVVLHQQQATLHQMYPTSTSTVNQVVWFWHWQPTLILEGTSTSVHMHLHDLWGLHQAREQGCEATSGWLERWFRCTIVNMSWFQCGQDQVQWQCPGGCPLWIVAERALANTLCPLWAHIGAPHKLLHPVTPCDLHWQNSETNAEQHPIFSFQTPNLGSFNLWSSLSNSKPLGKLWPVLSLATHPDNPWFQVL